MNPFLIVAVLVPLFLCTSVLSTQSSEYTSYWPGNTNIILSAPHGGYQQPHWLIPERVPGCPFGDGCIFSHDTTECPVADRDPVDCIAKIDQDRFTQEMLTDISDELTIQGATPYRIINHLHRDKLDANRDPNEATIGHLDAVIAWNQYHQQIEHARREVASQFGKGILFEIHGQSHGVQIELGYDISYSDLTTLTDDQLNIKHYSSSIRAIVGAWKDTKSFVNMLRGQSSFGHYMNTHVAGYQTTPSPLNPTPGDTDYFSGGYDIEVHSSLDRTSYWSPTGGSPVDAIQIEYPEDIRTDTTKRQQAAKDTASAILDFMSAIYTPVTMDSNSGMLEAPGYVGTSTPCSFTAEVSDTGMSGAQWENHVYNTQTEAETICNQQLSCVAILLSNSQYYLMPEDRDFVYDTDYKAYIRDCTQTSDFLITVDDTGTAASWGGNFEFSTLAEAQAICKALRDCQAVIDESNNNYVLMKITEDFTSDATKTAYLKFHSSMYRFYISSKSWPNAELQCVADGGHLASVRSDVENAAVLEVCDYLCTTCTKKYCWIGLTRDLSYSSDTKNWVWTDNTDTTITVCEEGATLGTPTVGQYNKWQSSEPDCATRNCAALRNDTSEWFDRECDSTTHDYVCEFGNCFLSEAVYNIGMAGSQWATFKFASRSRANDVCQAIPRCLAIIEKNDEYYLMPAGRDFAEDSDAKAYFKVCAVADDDITTTPNPYVPPTAPPTEPPSCAESTVCSMLLADSYEAICENEADYCTVEVDTNGDCSGYCAQYGLQCINAWNNPCGNEDEYHCQSTRNDQVCKCGCPDGFCSYLNNDYRKRCGQDATSCTVYVKTDGLTPRTCTSYCEKFAGLKCQDGWDDLDNVQLLKDSCAMDASHGCDNDEYDQICQCESST